MAEENVSGRPQDVVVTGRPVDAPRRAEPTKKYKLLAGKRHYHVSASGEPARLIQEGEEVELTDAQYLAFNDKFVESGQEDELTKRAREMALAMVAEMMPKPTSHLPQDLGSKTFDPNAPQVNVGNAVARFPPLVTQVGDIRQTQVPAPPPDEVSAEVRRADANATDAARHVGGASSFPATKGGEEDGTPDGGESDGPGDPVEKNEPIPLVKAATSVPDKTPAAARPANTPPPPAPPLRKDENK